MYVLFFVVFVDTVGFGIILPLQPFFAKQLGASDSVVTLVASAFTGAQLLFAPVWGALSDRIGRRPVILVTVAGTALGYAWLAFADTLWMLFLARAFGGMMAANIGVAHAYVADITPQATRARSMGRVGAAAGLGFVAGPAIGGLLAGADPANPAVHIPFLTAAGASGIAFFLALFVLVESRPAREAASATNSLDILRGAFGASATIAGRQLMLLLVIMFMTPFVFTAVETTLALWSSANLGWGATQNGVLYTYMGAVAIVVQGLCIGPLVGRLGERRTVLAAAMAAAVGAVSLPFATGYVSLMWGLGLIVFGISAAGPSLNSLVSAHASPDNRGRLMGTAQRSAGLGRFVGPAWGGASFEFLGRDWPAFAGAAVMLAMFLLALRIRRQPPESP